MSEFRLDAVTIYDDDAEQYVRKIAGDMLDTDDLDLSGVTFIDDGDGAVMATGTVRIRQDQRPQ